MPATWTLLEHPRRLHVEGHALYITGTIQCSSYSFLCQWSIYTPCEQVTDILPSMNEKTNLSVNGLRLILYNNTCILCMCLSHLRCPEWVVVSPHSLHSLEELNLASFTDYSSSLHNAWFERKTFKSFLAVMCRIPCTCRIRCMHCYTFCYPWQDESCPLLESNYNISQGYALRTCPPHHRHHSCYCFLQYEKLSTP